MSFNLLNKWTNEIGGILRITTAFMFLQHGTSKIIGFPDVSAQAELISFFGLVGALEIIFGLAVLIGWKTRLFAFLASGMMAIAYWGWHAIPHGNWLSPSMNYGEAAALFCFIFLFIAAWGPGAWSIDKK